MNEEITQLGDGLLSQIEGVTTEPQLTLQHFRDAMNEITSIALTPDEVIVDQGPRIEQPEESSPLSEEERQILEQAVEEAHNEIPTNSGSLLVDESTSRFSSAIWYEAIQKKVVILAGVGGIGSYVGFLLARIKPAALFIYDPDIVETVNMSGQLYSREDVGNPKVSALSMMISKYCDYNSVFAIPERFDESNDASDIMICGFDNMAARKLFFEKWLNHVKSK